MKNILKLLVLIACLSFTQVVFATDLLKPATSVDFTVKNTTLKHGDNLVIEATITGSNFSTTSFKIYQDDKLLAEDKDMTITDHTTAKPTATWKIPTTLKIDTMFYIDVLVKDASGNTITSRRKDIIPSSEVATPNTTTPSTTTPNTNQESLTGYKVTLNNKDVNLSDSETLVLYNGNLFTPVQGIINHMGYKSAYTPLDKTITISKESLSFTLKINENTFSVGDKKYTLKTAPFESNGTAFFPIDEVGRALNYMTYVDKTAKTVAFVAVSTDPATLSKLDRAKLDNNQNLPLTTQISKLDLVFPNESILAKNEWGAVIEDAVSEHKISFKYSFLGDGSFSRDYGFRKANTWAYMPGEVGKFTVDPISQTLKLDFLVNKASFTIKSTETYNIAYSRADSCLYYFDKTTNKFKLFGTELSKF